MLWLLWILGLSPRSLPSFFLFLHLVITPACQLGKKARKRAATCMRNLSCLVAASAICGRRLSYRTTAPHTVEQCNFPREAIPGTYSRYGSRCLNRKRTCVLVGRPAKPPRSRLSLSLLLYLYFGATNDCSPSPSTRKLVRLVSWYRGGAVSLAHPMVTPRNAT